MSGHDLPRFYTVYGCSRHSVSFALRGALIRPPSMSELRLPACDQKCHLDFIATLRVPRENPRKATVVGSNETVEALKKKRGVTFWAVYPAHGECITTLI
jgi:hypothetical protein